MMKMMKRRRMKRKRRKRTRRSEGCVCFSFFSSSIRTIIASHHPVSLIRPPPALLPFAPSPSLVSASPFPSLSVPLFLFVFSHRCYRLRMVQRSRQRTRGKSCRHHLCLLGLCVRGMREILGRVVKTVRKWKATVKMYMKGQTGINEHTHTHTHIHTYTHTDRQTHSHTYTQTDT